MPSFSLLETGRWKVRYVALRRKNVTWSRAQYRKRTIQNTGKEDESEDKKVVVPPVNKNLRLPIERVEIQPGSQQLAFRKALPIHASASIVERCESNVSAALPVRLARSNA